MGNENDSTQETFEKIIKFKKEVINPIFPNAQLKSQWMNIPNLPPESFKSQFYYHELFKNTNYKYKGNGKYIHYTTLIGLKLILESGFLRMSEFENLSDEKELLYAASVFKDNLLFKFDPEKLENLKKKIFCLSLCQSNKATKRNHLMWEVYGDKGKGIIIELELKNQKLYFPDYLLGKIQYGEEGLKPIKKLKFLTEEFLKKTPKSLFLNNFQEFIIELLSFHKVKIFKSEQEIRLVIKGYNLQYESPNTFYMDKNSNQEVKYFNKVYLKEVSPSLEDSNKINISENYPLIDIKNIILGYNISDKNKDDLMFFFKDLRTKNNYNFKISEMNFEGEIIDITYKI